MGDVYGTEPCLTYMSAVRPLGHRILLLRVMRWTDFGMRAAAVFLTSVVMFAAMVVISHSLKMTSEVTPFRPAAGRNLSIAQPVEAGSEWLWPETKSDVGPLHHRDTVQSEPVPVVTATPVPDDTAIASAATDTSPPSPDDAEPQTTVVATPVPSGERGPAPEREPPPVTNWEPAPSPAPTAAPSPRPTPTPASDPDPVPSPPEPEPTPSETESESASWEADAFTADPTASETPTTTP
jgi:hypothetical protein